LSVRPLMRKTRLRQTYVNILCKFKRIKVFAARGGGVKINYVPFQFFSAYLPSEKETQELSIDSDRATDWSRVLEFVLSESM